LWFWFELNLRVLQGYEFQRIIGAYWRLIYFGSLLLILALNLLAIIDQVRKQQRRAAAGIIIGLVCAPLAGIVLAIGACMSGGC
jgi:hypothetical protein